MQERQAHDVSEGPLPTWKVLKEEYEKLHKDTPFPEEYLKLTFYKDHIKHPDKFAIRIQEAQADGDPADKILVRVRESLPEQSRSDLREYVASTHMVSYDVSPKPPDSLQDEIVEHLNELLNYSELMEYFGEDAQSREAKEKAIAEYKEKLKLKRSDRLALSQGQLPYFNRILLEQAFPDDISKVNETLSGVFAHLHKANLSALCISGGGIRSASFGLGILQGLARNRMLQHFDYLSTVSGGGYLGSWLTAWIHRHPHKLDGVVTDIANTTPKSQKQPEPEPIHHLRTYSNYLSPKLGFLSADTWTLVATYLRNLILIWLVLIPLMAAVLMIPRICVAVVEWDPNSSHMGLLRWLFRIAFLLAAWAIAYIGFKRPSDGAQTVQKWFLIFCLVPVLLSAVLFTTFWALFRTRGVQLEDQFAIIAAQYIGLPAKLYGNTLLIFLIFGVSLHIAGTLILLIVWAVDRAWLWYKGKKKERDAAVKDDIKQLHSIRNNFSEFVIILITGATGGWLAWLGAVKLFPSPKSYSEIYVCFAAPLFISLLLLAVILFAGLVSRWTSDEDREWWARLGAWILITAVVWVALSVLVIFGPVWLSKIPEVIAPLGGISGIITLVLGRSSKTNAEKKPDSKTSLVSILMDKALFLVAPLFAAFIVIVISTLTTILLSWLSDKIGIAPGWPGFVRASDFEAWNQAVLRDSPVLYIALVLIALLIFGLIMGRAINTNKFSMHAMYRNRLIRAYLGASNDKRNPNLFTGFDDNDNIQMCELWPGKPDAERNKLFYVINTALNLVSGENLAWQERMAESFTVSPLHAGNKDLGYRRTEYQTGPANKRRYGGEKGISLGTAVTISGAAASPNMGYHSSTFVTFLLSLFNVRLGWWLGNTGTHGNKTYFLDSPKLAVRPIVEETLGLTDDKNPYIYLSDGGHFENLGVYEMVLRRCRFILVSDASQDPGCAFEDLGNAVRKIRIDLGVPIDLYDPICIYGRSKDKMQNEAGRYCSIGRIKYSCIDGTPESEDGILVYIKPAFYGREPRDIYQYAQKYQLFPHESTGDQFFSESQLESYRMLGSYIIDYIFANWDQKQRDLFEQTQDFSIVAEHVGKAHLSLPVYKGHALNSSIIDSL